MMVSVLLGLTCIGTVYVQSTHFVTVCHGSTSEVIHANVNTQLMLM